MCYIPPLRTRGEGLSVPNHRKTGHNRLVLSLLRIRSNVHNIIKKKPFIFNIMARPHPRLGVGHTKRRNYDEETMKQEHRARESQNAQRKTATCG